MLLQLGAPVVIKLAAAAGWPTRAATGPGKPDKLRQCVQIHALGAGTMRIRHLRVRCVANTLPFQQRRLGPHALVNTRHVNTIFVAESVETLARSTTQTSVGWIGYIIIGALAGWIAGKIVKGGGSGLLLNIVIGVVGALIGGFLLSFFLDTAGGGWWFTLFTAILGSVILLTIVGAVRKN